VQVEEVERAPAEVLARELRLLKDRAGLSLARLATKAWCSRSSLERYLNGKVFPPRHIVLAIADACGADTKAVAALWERAWAARANVRREPDPEQRPATPTPAQLPPDVRGFTGRGTELATLESAMAELDGDGAGPVLITAVAGTAGVGKTALAVHFGHRVAVRFPDGQLHLDLRGYSAAPPMTAVEALGRMLRSLGMPPDHLPADEQELAALYRSVMAGKRMLVMLDNARSAEQVTPLLPAGPRNLVVVTSRTTLATLDSAAHVQLDILPEPEALDLLRRLVGPDRVDAEPAAARTLVALCSRLPLAVRIAAARLAARPAWPVAALAEWLADETRRLDELRVGERAVRASFAVTYHALNTGDDPADRQAARMFRLLGVLNWVDMSVPIAAALLDRPQAEAVAALEHLLDARLLDCAEPGRYHTHDLLHLYAREQAQLDEAVADREAAFQRALDCYLSAATHATLLINRGATHVGDEPAPGPQGGFTLSGPADIPEWTDAQHANLVAVATQAAAGPSGIAERAVRLTAALQRPFNARGYWPDLLTLRGLAARVAHRIGDRLGEAVAYEDLALVNLLGGRTDDMIAAAQQALVIYRELGDRRGEAGYHTWLGEAYLDQGRLDEAVTSHQEGLALSRKVGDRDREARALNMLGIAYQRLGRFDEAVVHHHESLDVYREIGNRIGIASTLGNLGWAHYRDGRHATAIDFQGQALVVAGETGHRRQQAEFLWALGLAQHALGNHGQARTSWRHAIAILQEIGSLTAAQADVLRRQPIPHTPEIIRRSI
jgi:tetratricopeptide (TPR) repeat protein/transcriptional regulator with XRE-family HTH domain